MRISNVVRGRSRLGLLGVLAGVTLFAGGCAQQPYLSGYAYTPQPAVAEVYHRVGQQQQTPVTVLATLLGVRRADAKQGIPQSVAVRLRIENNGTVPVQFDPRTLDLVTGSLRGFPPPSVQPPVTLTIPPMQKQTVTAYFPFPPGAKPDQMNLNNLRLRWTLRLDNYPVEQSAQFQRIQGSPDPAEYDGDPYY